MIYITSDNDRLDQICFEHYGDEGHVEQVLTHPRNQHLLNQTHFKAGESIFLPHQTKPQPSVAPTVQLWD